LWQDYGMTIAANGFLVAMFPQVFKNWKDKSSPFSMQTIILNIVCLLISTVCVSSLKLYLTALTNILTITLWIIVGAQAIKYKNT